MRVEGGLQAKGAAPLCGACTQHARSTHLSTGVTQLSRVLVSASVTSQPPGVSMSQRIIFLKSQQIGEKPTKISFGEHKTTEQTKVLS